MKGILRKLATKIGLQINKLSPVTSSDTRLQYLFEDKKVDLVLDVGANIGSYAKRVREFGYKGKIVSFEPLSDCHAKLLSLSENDRLWEIAPRSAIGNEDGEIAINISANSHSSSVLKMLDSHLQAAPKSAYIGSEVVALTKLDTIAPQYITNEVNSVYLKIDVQGFEMQVLEGASQILPKIKGIQMELSLLPLYEGQILIKDTLDKMEKLGYEIYAIMPGFTDMKTGRLLQVDGIFFRI